MDIGRSFRSYLRSVAGIGSPLHASYILHHLSRITCPSGIARRTLFYSAPLLAGAPLCVGDTLSRRQRSVQRISSS